MKYTPRKAAAGDYKDVKDPSAPLYEALEPVAKGLGMALVELSVSRHKGSGSSSGRIQVRAVVCKTAAQKGGLGKGGFAVGVDDCSRAHHAMLPLLESAFPGQELYVELSSPGIDRAIKDGSEFVHYLGRGLRCYRIDISDWTGGVLQSADEKGIVLKGKDGMTEIAYGSIAKAKLDYTLDYLREV